MDCITKISRRFLLVAVALYAGFLVMGPGIAAYATSTQENPSGIIMDFPNFTDLSASGTSGSPGLAALVTNIYRYALGIAGTLAVVMIIYGGVKYIAQPDNTSARAEALDTVKSSIWGIALLAGAFLILNTINTDLVVLNDPALHTVAIPGDETFDPAQEEGTSSGGLAGNTNAPCTIDTDTTKGTVDAGKLAKLAKDVLKTENISLSEGGDCGSNTSPKSIMEDVAAGKSPYVCDNITKEQCSAHACKKGGSGNNATLCPQLLEGIIKAQKMVNDGKMPAFTINSLTGGIHESGSGHYKGMKMDVLAQGGASAEVWQKIRDGIASVFGSSVNCEYKVNGSTKLTSNCSGITGAGTSNQHIDVQAGGAGSQDLDDVGKYGDEVRKLATQYLQLSPRLKNNGSYGIPPDSTEHACVPSEVNPYSIVQSVVGGQVPISCQDSRMSLDPDGKNGVYSYCKCSPGGTNGKQTLGKELLQLLIDMEGAKKDGKIPDFMVVALMGGIQKYEGAASLHSTGQAFDVLPMNGTGISRNLDDWKKLRSFIKQKNYDTRYEYLRIVDGNVKYYETTDEPVIFSYYDSTEKKDVEETPVTCSINNSNVVSSPFSTLANMPKTKNACFDARIHVNVFKK